MDSQKIMKVLHIIFYTFVVATFVLYFMSYKYAWEDVYWFYSGCIAMGLAIIRFVMRFML